jgi:uncharacterized protein (TIGR01777 family)
MSEKIVIAGGSGFVGTYLAQQLSNNGYQVIILSRSSIKNVSQSILYKDYSKLSETVSSAKVVVNLAGHNLFDARWTEEVKLKIMNSRVDTTRKLVEAMQNAPHKPEVFISASASGYYGSREAEFLREDSHSGTDFLAQVCINWEKEALNAPVNRVVIPRIGIVLEKNGGALGKMITPFKLFVGGPLGNGKQFFPWVHMNDVVGSIIEAIKNPAFNGPYNCVAPQSVTMAQFANILGEVLNRPSLFSVPEFALNLVFGEAAEALIASQRVIPQQLKVWSYSFKFDDLKSALKDILA